jgi:hypothetical protein
MSFEILVPLVREYSSRGLLVDTNILLLFLVGSVNPNLVGSFKVTASQGFTESDFDLLQRFMGNFQKVVTTPHILTEVSNQADKLKGDYHRKVFSTLASLIEQLDERTEATKVLVKSDAFVRFGLTDTAIGCLAAEKFLVLTVDFPLVGYLGKRGADAINFNHLRQLNWTD